MTNNAAEDYRRADSRLLLLDYDGTLSPIKPTPPEAKPTSALLTLLQQLSGDPQNKVVIISGRDHQTLEAWLGHLPLDFASEHGLYIRESGQPWRLLHQRDTSWKQTIKHIADEYVRSVPGSFIEEKSGSLAWHYRAADPAQAAAALPRLLGHLRPAAAAEDLVLLEGNKVVDIKLAGANKGAVAQHWLKQRPWGFILAAGDDTTDEDLFRAMPDNAHTIKIGPGQTTARECLNSVRTFHAFLRLLTR